jgi:hypothetical protein
LSPFAGEEVEEEGRRRKKKKKGFTANLPSTKEMILARGVATFFGG